ncbi:hypothetical protein HD554DRAFT_1620389 [Boletus coccyginus]|nr:hypothetical protein HD554DRAFT_1620389 [Boletus coccyginus]
MPAYLNEEGIDIPVNKELSKFDKAFIMLNYPPNLKTPEKLKAFILAMLDAGVTDKAAGEILKAFNTTSPEKVEPDSDAGSRLSFWEHANALFGVQQTHNAPSQRERPVTECHRSQVLDAVRYQGLPRRRDKQQAFPKRCQERCQQHSVATRDSAAAVNSWSVAT